MEDDINKKIDQINYTLDKTKDLLNVLGGDLVILIFALILFLGIVFEKLIVAISVIAITYILKFFNRV